jgi:tetratricopeptide (TPR) repeat protein
MCVYEINTNPSLGRPQEHPFRQRTESMEIWWRALLAALHAIDTSDAGGARPEVDISGDLVEALCGAASIFPISGIFGRLAREQERRGDIQAAIHSARCAVAHSPDDAKLLRHLSELLANKNCLDEAIVLAERAASLAPRDASALAHRAKVLHKAGRGKEALELVLAAITLRPHRWVYYRLLSRIHEQVGEKAEAVKAAAEAVTLSPETEKSAAIRHLQKLTGQRLKKRTLRSVLCSVKAGGDY